MYLKRLCHNLNLQIFYAQLISNVCFRINAVLICFYIKNYGLDNTLPFSANVILEKDKLAKECFTERRTSRNKYM